MVRAILRDIDKNGERYLLLVFYSLVVAVIGLEVVRRFVLSFSSIWGEEIARFAFIYLTWIGASAGVKNRSHIRIDVIYSLTPSRHHVWLYVLADVATLAFVIVALFYSLTPIIASIQYDNVTDGLRINRSFFHEVRYRDSTQGSGVGRVGAGNTRKKTTPENSRRT